jgi:5-hydroxyisourate hydrolase-like protein (transthyretin family)
MLALAALCLVFSSCGEEQFRKETFPVTGEVHVDGQPAADLAVRCIDVKGLDKEHPTTSSAFTDQTGKFEISTYETADGVPAGDYVLTFQWGQWNRMTMSYGGDKLDGRYADAKKSEVRFTVQQGQPTDLGRIDLTTK